MKYLLFISILFLSSTLFAQEYGPHAKLTFKASEEIRSFSGTVIESPDDTIKVITCWHGTMGVNSPKYIDAQLFSQKVNNTQLSASIQLSVLKTDSDKDVMVSSGPNTLKLKIKRLKIGSSTLLEGTKTRSYGYGQSLTLIENSSVVIKQEYQTPKGFNILSVRAPVVYGMSGGGLLHNGELFGVQSSGKDNKVSYCPANQLLEFINDN